MDFFANLICYGDPPASLGMPYTGLSYTMSHSIIEKVEISYSFFEILEIGIAMGLI